MFSGIVEAIGVVEAFNASGDGCSLTVVAESILAGDGGLRESDSVCVSGACLTATRVDGHRFAVDVSAETLRRTWFHALVPGSRVNLERALRYGDRVGGHLVQGHVDGVGRVAEVRDDGDAKLVRVDCAEIDARYTVEKGFVALDGASLTCFNCDENGFSFTMIPYTANHTTLGDLEPGDYVNIETDMNAKYIERSLSDIVKSQGISGLLK